MLHRNDHAVGDARSLPDAFRRLRAGRDALRRRLRLLHARVRHPGTGASVCMPAGGCRMTGDYCDTQASCCGGTNADYGGGNTSYSVTCEKKNSTSPATCDSGTGCNPPGNICGGGGTVNASQNCCWLDANMVPQGGGVQGHSACKPDSGGIMRCFGGPVTPTCPDGWDADRPGCCIQAGQVCQFSDQCCNGVPCVPDGAGVLRCAATNPPGGGSTCAPRGATCTAAGEGNPGTCCSGLACYTVPGTTRKECLETTPGPTCYDVGRSCTSGLQCCTGYCYEGTVCGGCAPNGATCDAAADCCSSFCSTPASARRRRRRRASRPAAAAR